MASKYLLIYIFACLGVVSILISLYFQISNRMLSGVYCLAGGGLVLISGAVILLMQQPDPLAGLQGFIGLVMSVVGFGYACYGIFLMLTARKWMDRRPDV